MSSSLYSNLEVKDSNSPFVITRVSAVRPWRGLWLPEYFRLASMRAYVVRTASRIASSMMPARSLSWLMTSDHA